MLYAIIVGSTLLLALGVMLLLNTRDKAIKRRLNSIQEESGRGERKAGKKTSLVSKEGFEKSKLSSNRHLSQVMLSVSNELEAAGLGDDPIRLILVWIIMTIVIPMIESLLNIRLMLIVITIIVSAVGPLLYIYIRKKHRLTAFEKQLPPALDIICNALKAGYTFQLAMNTVAKELDDPISEEFLMAFSETQYGVGLGTALKNMAKRTGSKDIELLEIAVSVQTSVGGNMIEILQNISRTLVEKHNLQEEIKAKTASGKLTGMLLAVPPVFLLIVLNLINPDYVSIFFADLTGKIMLGVAALWELLGFLVIRKILNVKY